MQNKVRFPFLIEARLPPPATLFSPLVTPGHITSQIPGPLIFPVVAVNGGQLYKFIQVEQKVYRQHRQFQHKCRYDAHRNNDYPHRYQIAQQAKFCIPSCAENSWTHPAASRKQTRKRGGCSAERNSYPPLSRRLCSRPFSGSRTSVLSAFFSVSIAIFRIFLDFIECIIVRAHFLWVPCKTCKQSIQAVY